MEKFGNIGESHGVYEFQWEIPKFPDKVLQAKTKFRRLKSHEFNFLDTIMYLYLKIEDRQRPSEWIGLYVVAENSHNPVHLIYTFGIKMSDGKKINRFNGASSWATSGASNFLMDEGRGCSKFMLTSDVLSDNSPYLKSECLTIICSLKRWHADVVSRREKLSVDLMELMTTAGDSDVTFSVKGVNFPAHRKILAARSRVFNCLFKHDITKKATGIVEIDDCEASTFRTFLGFLYGGTVDLTSVNLTDLFEIAEKFQVSELKVDCLKCINANLSVNGFCDVFTLAKRYNEKVLLRRAFQFFQRNKVEILTTPNWKEFLSINPGEAEELLTMSER